MSFPSPTGFPGQGSQQPQQPQTQIPGLQQQAFSPTGGPQGTPDQDPTALLNALAGGQAGQGGQQTPPPPAQGLGGQVNAYG